MCTFESSASAQASAAATAMVVVNLTHKNQSKGSHRCRDDRKVHFNLEATTTTTTTTCEQPQQADNSANIIGTNSNPNNQAVVGRWYGKLEYRAFEAIVAKAAKHMRAEPPRPFSYQHIMEHVDYLCHHQQPHSGDDNDADNNNVFLPMADRRTLQQLLQRGAPLGMERWAVTKLENHSRARRREQYKIAIQEGNHRHQKKENRMQDDHEDNHSCQHQDVEALAQQCRRISRPGRLFATAMAQALAAVVREDQSAVQR